MRSFLLKVGLFTICLLMLNLGYLFVLRQTDWNFRKRVEFLRLPTTDYDLIVAGNSLPMDGFDSEYLSEQGVRSYNLAIGGASIATSLLQLEEYLEASTQPPRYVVLGLGSYVGDFEETTIHPLVEFTSAAGTLGLDDIPMIKFKWMFQELLKKMVSPTHRRARIVSGQLRFDKQVKDRTATKVPADLLPIARFSNSNYLHRVAALCAQYGSQLIIVEMPAFAELRNQSPAGCYYLPDFPGETLLVNFNSVAVGELFDPSTDWVGRNHLNTRGARKFTENFLRMLKAGFSDCKISVE